MSSLCASKRSTHNADQKRSAARSATRARQGGRRLNPGDGRRSPRSRLAFTVVLSARDLRRRGFSTVAEAARRARPHRDRAATEWIPRTGDPRRAHRTAGRRPTRKILSSFPLPIRAPLSPARRVCVPRPCRRRRLPTAAQWGPGIDAGGKPPSERFFNFS